MRPGKIITVGICGALALVPGTGGCRRGRSTGEVVTDSSVVAAVGDVRIAGSQVASQMRRRHVDAQRALQDLVTFEILARAAAEASVENSTGDLVADSTADLATGPGGAGLGTIRAAKVERLIEREIEPRLTKDAISEADVRALYDRGKARFVHGRLVQIAVLCVFTGARMKPEARARAEGNARALKTWVDGLRSSTSQDFEAIAKDPAWIERKVSFTTAWQTDDVPFPRVVGHAVAALSKPGDTTDLLGDETGYYIARYLSDRPPENVSFAEASPHLREEMYEPWRRQRFLQLSLEMSDRHDIQIFPENLPLLAGSPRPP